MKRSHSWWFLWFISQGRYYAITAILILCHTFAVSAAQSSLGEHRSIYGMMLIGHTFRSTKAANWPQCIKTCNDEIRCQSINYDIDKGMCELNKRTKEARPEHFISATHRVYMTRYNERVPLGSIPDLPAESCAEIQGSEGESVVNGLYWLDSVILGSTIQAYCGPLPEECVSYQYLTDGYRKETASSVNTRACDNGLGPAWFRFFRDAGTKMPTSCVPAHQCGTDAPGWLNGSHPTVADGQVTRQVCFTYHNSCCSWNTNIQVRNCGDFFVYFLNGTSPEHSCFLRYCGTD